MNMRSQIQFDRIAEAIDYLQKNFQEQPNLDDVAKYIHWFNNERISIADRKMKVA